MLRFGMKEREALEVEHLVVVVDAVDRQHIRCKRHRNTNTKSDKRPAWHRSIKQTLLPDDTMTTGCRGGLHRAHPIGSTVRLRLIHRQCSVAKAEKNCPVSRRARWHLA